MRPAYYRSAHAPFQQIVNPHMRYCGIRVCVIAAHSRSVYASLLHILNSHMRHRCIFSIRTRTCTCHMRQSSYASFLYFSAHTCASPHTPQSLTILVRTTLSLAYFVLDCSPVVRHFICSVITYAFYSFLSVYLCSFSACAFYLYRLLLPL
jgi:hypothetical protein